MADTVGTRIMMLRGQSETQEQLAAALGVSRSLVKAWENNGRPVLSTHVVKLSEHFGVSCDYLLGIVGEDNSTKDENLRKVSEYTGLSNDAIVQLEYLNEVLPASKKVLSYLLCSSRCTDFFMYIHEAVSALRVSKLTGSAEARRQARLLTLLQDATLQLGDDYSGDNLMLDDGTPLNIPKGTTVISAFDASETYKSIVAKLFSEALDSYVDSASEVDSNVKR